MNKDENTRPRRWPIIVGWIYVVFGVLLAANALVSGSRAFGSGRLGVIVMVLSGSACAACGVWLIARHRKK
jgi:hypothetical protein